MINKLIGENMKRIYALLIITILLAGFSKSVSQEYQKFKAKAGYTVALGQAKTDASDMDGNPIAAMTDPKLVAIGTVGGGDVEGVPIEVGFDMNTGNATIWLYIFRDGDNPEYMRSIVVMKIFIFIPIDFPIDQAPELPIGGGDNIDYEKWEYDSDGLVDRLTSDQTYNEYIQTYPNATFQMLLLTVNTEQALLTQGHIIWAGLISDTESPEAPVLTCLVDAETGETICLSAVSVPEDIEESVMVYPNPASDKAIISLPNELLEHNPTIAIYNSQGEFIRNIEVPGGITSNLVLINVSDLNSGVYFVHYSGSTFKFMKKMIISR